MSMHGSEEYIHGVRSVYLNVESMCEYKRPLSHQ